jgi:hypothetical protein
MTGHYGAGPGPGQPDWGRDPHAPGTAHHHHHAAAAPGAPHANDAVAHLMFELQRVSR